MDQIKMGVFLKELRKAKDTHSLRVRSPRTASFMVGVAYGIAGNDALMADLTKLSHRSHLL